MLVLTVLDLGVLTRTKEPKLLIARNSISIMYKLELDLIQTQMTQKPMLRAEVYVRALRIQIN